MKANGNGLINLTKSTADDEFAAWSPDGRHILYTTDGGGDGDDIWIMDSDGTNHKPFIEAPGDEFQAAWTSTSG